MNKLMIIIDSNYLCYVARYAMPPLSYHGERTEIIYGFLKNIIELLNKFETTNLVFCWDSADSVRRELCPEYKLNRMINKTQQDLQEDQIAYTQFSTIRDKVLPDLGFNNVFLQRGYESDDLIASIVMTHNDTTNIVVTSDNDLLQLLDYCTIYNPKKGGTITKDIFIREYGIEPKQWIKLKTYAGCSTDNVQGVKGIGITTALRYIKGELLSGVHAKLINCWDTKEKQLTEKLVKLPFPGTRQFTLKLNTLSLEKYIAVCRKYNFESLLKESIIRTYRTVYGKN